MLSLPLSYFILHNFVHFLDVSLVNYLSVSLYVCSISMTKFKEFRMFGTCSFTNLLVKVTNNFWKSRGLVEKSNKLHRQIASGVEKRQTSR